MAHGEENAHRRALSERQARVLAVQLGAFARQAFELRDDRGARGPGEHAVHDDHVLVRAIEARAEVLIVRLLLEETLDRPVRQPGETGRHQQPHAVAGLQLDEAQAIEPHEKLDALGLREIVRRHDLLHAHVVQRADRNEEKLPVRDDLLLLLVGELGDELFLLMQGPRQIGELGVRKLAHLVEAVEREAAPREHPLDARLAQPELVRYLRVGDAARLQLPLEDIDHRGAVCHGATPPCFGARYHLMLPPGKPAATCGIVLGRAGRRGDDARTPRRGNPAQGKS